MDGNGMNERIKAGADIHAGDFGYEIGTKEAYDEFVKKRNQSLKSGRIKELAEQAGGHYGEELEFAVVFGELEDFEKFAELIVRECIAICESGTPTQTTSGGAAELIKQHFGVVTKQQNS